jgi:LuxR family transcriptional regulator, maltose regulon positive regulatory protein
METKMRGLSSESPTGNYVHRDPDVQKRGRLDGSMVGASGSRNATPRAVLSTIERTARGEASTGREASGAASLSAWRARFFGHFELLRDGEPVHLRRNGKALAILKYLLANHSRPVSQDHLMGWLWPESNLKKARWSLNSAIHGLRKLLSECPSSAPVNYIVLEEGYYRLCSTIRVATDVDEFDARYEEGRRLEKMNRTQEAASQYEKAVELYRGDYLVEDLYEDWTMVERERLSTTYMEMLGRLAHHHMEAGQHQESIRACYRLLEIDRSHEDSYRVLIRCYVNLGLRGRALRHYQLCEEVLEQTYNTVPASETKALHRSIILG